IATAINNCGTTFRDYRDGHGKTGFNQHYLNVYGRAGKGCPVCRQSLIRLVVGGRGTVYCRSCQT
ncbi:MAG: DNA-formamidopyrimidine glycosylase, partial [Negativicutes bacterium]|nr:DNA-formamidopyrimidine glycosylase [Negativicutes bacterium]